MNKKIALGLISLLTIVFLAGCGEKEIVDNRVIAEVGGIAVTKTQLDHQEKYLKAIYEDQLGVKLDETVNADILARLKDQAYSNLVMEAMVIQDAANQNIKADQAMIDTSVNQLKNYLKEQNVPYADFLNRYSLTEAEYLHKLEIDSIMNQLFAKVSADISVTPEEERAYYEANVATLFTQKAGIQISHILVTEEELAKDLIEQLNNGADFATLAQENSLDGSAVQGGDLGNVDESTNFVPEFKTAALALEPGEYTKEPVQSTYGYHIIKAGERVAATVMPYEEVNVQINTQLLDEKINAAFEAYLSGLENYIEIIDRREPSDYGTQPETASEDEEKSNTPIEPSEQK